MDLLVYHNTILDLLRKQRLDTPTHQVIDEFTHLAQIEVFERLYAKYGEMQEEQDGLAPFKVYAPFTSDTTGVVVYPSDYAHLIAVTTTTYDNARQVPVSHKVQFVQEDKLSDALDNQVRIVSILRPIATNNSTSIVLFPRVQQSGHISYFKLPIAPKLVYTLSGRTLTYNQPGSTQLLFPEMETKEIMLRTLGYLGLNINQADLIQFEQIKEVKN